LIIHKIRGISKQGIICAIRHQEIDCFESVNIAFENLFSIKRENEVKEFGFVGVVRRHNGME
jgi:hypothetical protein